MSGVTTSRLEIAEISRNRVRLTIVIGANLECLVSAHDKSGLAVFLVLQKTDIAGASLLPFTALTIELEELCAHFESDLCFPLVLSVIWKASEG